MPDGLERRLRQIARSPFCVPCKKVGYRSKALAEAAIVKIRQGKQRNRGILPGDSPVVPKRAYLCGQGWWHLTKLEDFEDRTGVLLHLPVVPVDGRDHQRYMTAVEQALATEILRAGPGIRLPAGRDIAEQYGATPKWVIKVRKRLVERGLLVQGGCEEELAYYTCTPASARVDLVE